MPFVLAFCVALLVVPVSRAVGAAYGLTDDPAGDPLKVHGRPIPVLGGVAVVASAFVALMPFVDRPSASIAAAIAIALAAGLLDDVIGLSPLAQVSMQGSAALVLVAGGTDLHGLGALAPLAIVLLVVAGANGVNLIDGQDGLAGGLAAIASLGLAAVAAQEGSTLSALALAVAGALAAFLIWNFPRARIFLGNSGAYATGTVLAVLVVDVVARAGWKGFFAAGLCVGVFAFELCFTVARRLGSRRLTVGDRLHSYDLLLSESRSRTKVTLSFWAVGVAATLLGLAANSLPLSGAAVIAAMAFACAALGGRRLWVRQTGVVRPPSAPRTRLTDPPPAVRSSHPPSVS